MPALKTAIFSIVAGLILGALVIADISRDYDVKAAMTRGLAELAAERAARTFRETTLVLRTTASDLEMNWSLGNALDTSVDGSSPDLAPEEVERILFVPFGDEAEETTAAVLYGRSDQDRISGEFFPVTHLRETEVFLWEMMPLEGALAVRFGLGTELRQIHGSTVGYLLAQLDTGAFGRFFDRQLHSLGGGLALAHVDGLVFSTSSRFCRHIDCTSDRLSAEIMSLGYQGDRAAMEFQTDTARIAVSVAPVPGFGVYAVAVAPVPSPLASLIVLEYLLIWGLLSVLAGLYFLARHHQRAIQSRSQSAIKESEHRLRAIFDGAGVGIAALSPSGTISVANTALGHILGVAPEELTGQSLLDLVDSDDTTELRQGEVLLRRRCGDTVWVSQTVTARESGEPHERGWFYIAEDITARKRAQEALRDSKQMLQLVLDSIPVRVSWKDKELAYIGCNRQFARDAGLSDPTQVVGKTDFDLAWAGHAELHREIDRRVIVSAEPRFNIEGPLDRPGMDRRWLRTSKVPLPDAEGETIGVLSCYEDITEVRRAQEALRESEELYRGIADNSPAVICLKDARGAYFRVNREFERIHGLSAADVIGKTAAEVLPPELARRVEEQDGRVLEHLTAISHEQIVKTVDGERTYLDIRFPLTDDLRRRILIGVISSDITGLKEAERKMFEAKSLAEQASHAKSSFLAAMSHELRTPLNSVIGFAEMIETESLVPDPMHCAEYAGDIREAGRHLLSLINDMLDIARIEAGRMPIELRLLDLRESVTAATRFLREATDKKAISIDLRLGDQPLYVHGDERAMRQVFLNLLSNSVKFTPDHGSITVDTCRNRPDILEIAVHDTGIGIPAGDLDRVLQPFEQVGSHYTRASGGSGLGLALARSLMELQGGQMKLESQLGSGTTVRISMPERTAADADLLEAPERWGMAG